MTLPPDVADMRRAAEELGWSYNQFQTAWRTIEGFPAPFVGAGRGERPRWSLPAIREFKAGRRWPAHASGPVAASAHLPIANDPVPRPIPDAAAALLAFAGA